MIPFILTQNQITMVIHNKPYTVDNEHLNYEAILEELRGNQDPDVLIGLVDIPKTMQEYISKDTNELIVNLDAGLITFNGKEVNSVLVTRILDMYKGGFDVTPMVNFMYNLYQNPSERAVNELYSFLEYGKLPITPDGHFLAYKKVNNDYTSVHDSTFENKIGTVVSMPREQVDDNSDRTCSSGLHLCSHEYLSFIGGSKVLILKVNPRDVVSIPTDYNNTKARACQYEIIGELGQTDIKTIEQKNPVLTEIVADLSDYEIEPTAVNENYSEWFRIAYTHGYYEGKNKFIFDDTKVIPNFPYTNIFNIKTFVKFTEQEAIDYNNGYEIGFKHGRAHKKRLVPQLKYDPTSRYTFIG